MDDQQFRKAGIWAIDYFINYMNGIRDRNVLPSVEPGYLQKRLPHEAPEEPESWQTVVADIEEHIMPGITHWHSPHFHAYFTTAQSPPALLADILSSTIACIGFTWIASPACTELEMITMDWLGKMLRLPDHFLFSSGLGGGGVIQGTASESTHMSLLAAKAKAVTTLLKANPHWKAADIRDRLVVYASDQAHSSVERAALLACIRCHLVKANEETLAMKAVTLAKVIEDDRQLGFLPMAVVVTLGTTNTVAFDELDHIGPLCAKEKLWLHVDAAYAGAAFICPEFRPLLAGVEYADSYNSNPHKWMLVNFDCSTLWIRHREDFENAFKVDPLYLRHPFEGSEMPDYRHWGVPLGRRFRSLKLWFVMRMYGVKGLQEYIRKSVALAKEFEHMIQQDERFEIVFPTTLGLVCFRYKGTNRENKMLLEKVHERKKIFLSPCEVNGRYILRFAICGRLTETTDILFAWSELLTGLHAMITETTKTCVDEEQQLNEGALDNAVWAEKHCLVERLPLPGDKPNEFSLYSRITATSIHKVGPARILQRNTGSCLAF
ncbi:aromatic-L-amino-acid decarboxylase-like isoform X2 [Varroa destructor]|uniref:Aromatic-L-amino-acid decarboxylase n=1 Tax=Varroa destructor TaxID=109461 RepID=A0A7M7K5I7_VARDE|nr:aromatic-L-amino-acid decarboxylase-like isoform X2 [Varroa destructor]